MSCGDGDLFCDVLSFAFGEHGLVFSTAAKAVWNEHGERLIALAGLAFGIWKWWVYRERILHRRLAEYVSESDRRLIDGEKYILDAIQRPTPSRLGKLPLFASPELRRVLVRHNWDGTVIASGVEASVEAQLDTAKDWIDRRLQAAETATMSLRKQLATVHVLKGAIASSDPNGAKRALRSFRAAQAVPGHEVMLVAKELEALQLRNEGKVSEALARFSEFAQLAQQHAVCRDDWLRVARAKQFVAELTQAKAAYRDQNGTLIFPMTVAFAQVSPAVDGSAISIRAQFGPYEDWEQLELARLHYLAAFLAHVAGYVNAEPSQREAAKSTYDDCLSLPLSPVWKRTSNEVRIRSEALEGAIRVDQASARKYDTAWLFPYLYEAKH